MQIQKSFKNQAIGTLYVVPTPIGNLEDITLRALKVLKTVSIIAAEDTRKTKKLLNHFEITTPLISYHEHNKKSREREMLARLEQGGAIAIVSDAGMPAVSDPGNDLVLAATAADYPVVVLPGANAALCALVGSGLPTEEFLFYGFLPRKKKERRTELQRLKNLKATLVFYESPYRLKETLQALLDQLGNRKMAIARELTKRFEEYVRGSIEELVKWANEQNIKGEFCLIVEGVGEEVIQENDLWWSHHSINEHVESYIDNENLSSKEAIKRVANERSISKRDVYQAYHIGD